MIGGLGICGRPFCCSQFLDGFMPVSIKMAKVQNLSLNPTKISGTCGRLMCCLKYEQNAYEDAAKRMPKNESFVMTPDGPGNVKSVDLLQEKVKVSLDSDPEPQKCYHNCEVCVLRNGKGGREGVEIPQERPARYVEETKEDPDMMMPVITTPFYMDSQDRQMEERAERAPQREKIGGPESREKPRHRRHSRRSGVKAADGSAADAKPQETQQKDGAPVQKKRPPRPTAKKPEEGASATETGQSGENRPRRRPHHRGGRRRNHGGKTEPDAPKSE